MNARSLAGGNAAYFSRRYGKLNSLTSFADANRCVWTDGPTPVAQQQAASPGYWISISGPVRTDRRRMEEISALLDAGKTGDQKRSSGATKERILKNIPLDFCKIFSRCLFLRGYKDCHTYFSHIRMHLIVV